MIDNSRYTDHNHIFNRLARALRGTDKILSKSDILEWCQEVETEFCPQPATMYRYMDMEFTVTNNRITLPCHIYEIKDVFTNLGDYGTRVPYANPGSFLSFHPSLNLTKVYMNYIGTPIDIETGIPLILKGHEQACFWYCMYMMYLPEILDGKKGEIVLNKENELAAAKGESSRHKDNASKEHEQRIQYEMIPIPGRIKLMSNDWY